MARRKIFNEEDARRCLAAVRSAPGGLGEWSRANGIDGRSLNLWRKNLERRGLRTAVVVSKLIELVPAPVDGHLYLFLKKRRRLAKALWFDGSGWCLLAKRLEAGSFQLPPFSDSDSRVEVDGTTFAAIIAGIDFTAARRGWYRRPRTRGIDSQSSA